MWNILVTSFNAIFPIIALILLGYVLKKVGFFNDNFIKTGNKFVFRVCLPCMLFVNIYEAMDSFADIRWNVVLYSVIIICLLFALGLGVSIIVTKRKDRRGVILQCAFRSNFAIIGLTLVERLGGDTGTAGILSAFSIPIFNILAVVALTVFVGNETSNGVHSEADAEQTDSLPLKRKRFNFKCGAKAIILNIIKNPLIIGVVAGLVCVGIRELERVCCGGEVVFRLDNQLKFVYICITDIKAIASPLALLILGGQFKFTAVKGMSKEIVAGTLCRVLLAPLIGIGLAYILSTYTRLLEFGTEVYPALIALFGTPVAVSSAIMAGEMKNDEQLATQLVVWTSICSVVTVFVTVVVLISGGLISV